MNRFHFAVAVLSFTFVILSPMPVLASDHAQAIGRTQPAQFYHHPITVYVEDDSPRVIRRSRPQPEPVYLIPTGLQQPASAPLVVLPGPGQAGGAGGGIVAPPGYAVIDPSHPAPARFGSNIPAGGMAPAMALPNGNTTNRLAGKMWDAPKSPAETIVLPGRVMPAGDAVAKTASYRQPTHSGVGAGSSASTVKTAVKGDLLKK